MDTEQWQGLSVRDRDGRPLGIVVDTFAEGPLAGRLRVHGDYVPGRYTAGLQVGTAVFAIPRRAVVHRHQDSLVLATTLGTVRGKWLMHVLQPS